MQTHTNTFLVISLLLLLLRAIIWANVTYIHIPLQNELKLFDRPTSMDQMQASVTNHTLQLLETHWNGWCRDFCLLFALYSRQQSGKTPFEDPIKTK